MVAQISKLQENGYVSLEEWMNYEDPNGERYEFIDGQLIRIVESSFRHARLVTKTSSAFDRALTLKKSICSTTTSSLKVFFEDYDDGGYPDVAVVCGKPQLKNNNNNVIINPTLVVEILSPSTEDYDRGGKFLRYRSLPSFKEYVLVSQDDYKIETWFRLEENVWRIGRFEGLEAVMQLQSLDLEIPLADIYFGIEEWSDEPFGKQQKKRKRIREKQ